MSPLPSDDKTGPVSSLCLRSFKDAGSFQEVSSRLFQNNHHHFNPYTDSLQHATLRFIITHLLLSVIL